MLSYVILLLAIAIGVVKGQTPTTTSNQDTTTVSVIALDTSSISGQSLLASVMAANPTATTYALACAGACAVDFTITYISAPSSLQYYYSTSNNGGFGIISESCEVPNPTSVRCTGSVSASIEGRVTGSGVTSAINAPTQALWSVVQVTAGATKIGAVMASASVGSSVGEGTSATTGGSAVASRTMSSTTSASTTKGSGAASGGGRSDWLLMVALATFAASAGVLMLAL